SSGLGGIAVEGNSVSAGSHAHLGRRQRRILTVENSLRNRQPPALAMNGLGSSATDIAGPLTRLRGSPRVQTHTRSRPSLPFRGSRGNGSIACEIPLVCRQRQ